MLQATGYPPLRAALYRALERLPGVQLRGWRQDRVGRRGVAIAATEHGIREVLLIDPATANALELDQIQVTQPPSRGAPIPRQPPNGTVVAFSVFLNRAVVNSQTALPGGGNMPFKSQTS